MVINNDDLKVMCRIERDNVLLMYMSPLLTRNDFQTQFFSPFSQIKENPKFYTYIRRFSSTASNFVRFILDLDIDIQFHLMPQILLNFLV